MTPLFLGLAMLPAAEPEPPVAADLVLLGGKVWTVDADKPQAEAVAMIVSGAGSHFDPAIVKAVIRLCQRGDLLPSNWKHLLPPRDSGVSAAVPARR